MHNSSPRRRRSLMLIAAVAALVMSALTACGGTESTGASGSRDGTLALSILGTPNSFDPAQLVEGQGTFVWSSIFDTLLYSDGKGELKPNAAESWNYSDDGRTLTLKLRKGMTFSSGAPVNAAAVKATLDRTKATPASPSSRLGALQSVEAPDDSTVVLRLSRPDSGMLDMLARSQGVIGDPATLNDERTKLNPVASGAYALNTGQTVNGSVYVLDRREDYWNAEEYPFKTVKIRVISEPTAGFNALQAGETNAGYADSTQVERIRNQGFDIATIEASTTVNVIIADRAGETLPALADPRVRRAINMAFDRPKMVEQLLRGDGKPTQQIFNPKLSAYDPALERTYSYDVAGAKKLLAEAGYPNGFAVTMPELFYTKPFGPSVGQALDAIGIKVTWEPVPPQQSVSALTAKRFPMFLAVDGISNPATEVAGHYAPDGARNPFHSTDPRLTALIDQVNRELDPSKAGDLYKKINAFVVQEAWDAPVFFLATHWATKKGITYLSDGTQSYSSIRLFGVS